MSRTTAADRENRPLGFTLIEVLVVVAIIALLVAILLPSLAAARAQTRIVICATNMKTLGTATMYYAQASKDDMPSGWMVDDDGNVELRDGKTQAGADPWEYLFPYVQKLSMRKGQSIDNLEYSFKIPTYACPDDRKQHTTSQRPMKTPSGNVEHVEISLSYGANLNLLRNDLDDPTKGTRKMSSIRNASSMVTYNDGGDDGSDRLDVSNVVKGWVLADCRADFNVNQCFLELRHKKEGNNFAYLDSHIEFKKMNNKPKEYGLPPFPSAWVPNWTLASDPSLADLPHTAPIPPSEVVAKCMAAGC